jgi:hypothetical protein
MGEVWMRSVAPICDGKLEDFKRLAQDLLSTIREKDPDELNHASFLDESARMAVFLEHHASSAAGSRITRTSTGWCRASRRSASSRSSSSTVTRRRRCAALDATGPATSYYPTPSAL